MTGQHLGEILLERGLVGPDQLLAALDEQANTGCSLVEALLGAGAITEDDTVKVLAEQAGLEFVDLDEYPVDRAATLTISTAVAKHHRMLPIAFDGDALVVAMAEPGDILALDDAQSMSGRPVRPVVCQAVALDRAITRWMRSDEEIDHLGQSMGDSFVPEEAESSQVEIISEDSPVVRYVNLLISQAISDGASDIHLEPAEHELRVRYRIDGVLHEAQSAPKSIQSQVISRVKILSEMDIAERRKPQDGRITVAEDGKSIDLRVASLPTVWGEKIVMRVLDTQGVTLNLKDLSFEESNLTIYEQSFRKP
ncbi:MAG: Flp pilus assembly complex ATPase component TadA, partial [Bifidobacteriaceae bacterium]|nr:Flp pilus assembly complex ATPase component TadA [Bifidobacteriaceae bacterium]